MRLEIPSKADMEIIRSWRNESPQNYRTTIQLTAEQQEDYYNRVICDRKSDTRLWMVWEGIGYQPEGMVGVEFLSLENRNCELLFIWNKRNPFSDTEAHAMLHALLDKCFNYLNLETVYIECYQCNDIYNFWKDVADLYSTDAVMLSRRRYYNGKYHDSLYFTIHKSVMGVINAR